jgi:flavin-binding protein dodecin
MKYGGADRIMASVRRGQTLDLLAWQNGQTIRMTVRHGGVSNFSVEVTAQPVTARNPSTGSG